MNNYFLGAALSGIFLSLVSTQQLRAADLEKNILGALNYGGGFVQGLSATFKPAKVNGFQIKVPSFCKDVEILDVAASVEGVSVTTSSRDSSQHTYSVNGGSGSVIDTITVSLNGPPDAKCTIPLIEVEAAAAPTLNSGNYDLIGTSQCSTNLYSTTHSISYSQSAPGNVVLTARGAHLCSPFSNQKGFYCADFDDGATVVPASEDSYYLVCPKGGENCVFTFRHE